MEFNLTTEDIQLLIIALIYADGYSKSLTPEDSVRLQNGLSLLNRMCNEENNHTLKIKVIAE